MNDRIRLTPFERRTLARAAGRGLRAKRIRSTLPRRTVEVMRLLIAFVDWPKWPTESQ